VSRAFIVIAAGACVAAAGTFLAAAAGTLSTRWVRGEGMSLGYPDPALRQTYTTLGLIALAFGLTLVCLGLWKWLVGRPGAPLTHR
jgi:hypothetical protein